MRENAWKPAVIEGPRKKLFAILASEPVRAASGRVAASTARGQVLAHTKWTK